MRRVAAALGVIAAGAPVGAMDAAALAFLVS